MFELRGRLLDIVRDYITNAFRITIEVRQIPKGIDQLFETDLKISLKKWRDKRSLTANAYYWVLVSKIADHIKQPQPLVHNLLLRRYGVLDIVEGDSLTVFVPDTEEAENEILLKETYHLRPTSKVITGKKGNLRAYRIMLGSSFYDTKQFSTLLDGCITECRSMGIEVLPKDEIERMMADYAKHNEHH